MPLVQKNYIKIKICILYVFCLSTVIFLEGCKWSIILKIYNLAEFWDTMTDTNSKKHAKYLYARVNSTRSITVDIQKTYKICILIFHINWLYLVLVIHFFHQVLRPFAIYFTFIHCIYIFNEYLHSWSCITGLIMTYIRSLNLLPDNKWLQQVFRVWLEISTHITNATPIGMVHIKIIPGFLSCIPCD
jgi:hypothetical protein